MAPHRGRGLNSDVPTLEVAGAALGSRWTYEAFDVAAQASMHAVREYLLSPDIVAANVVMPHKQWAARTADTATPAVERSGAANFLIPSENGIHAHNTDMDAFVALAPQGRIRRALLLGAGGAARASIAALGNRVDRAHSQIEPRRLLNRSENTLRRSASKQKQSHGTKWRQLSPRPLIVNATPIGKRSDHLPAWGSAEPAADTFIYDYVYAKHITSTMRYATMHKLPYADGGCHLWAQAAAMVPLLNLPDETTDLLRNSLHNLRLKHPGT